MEIVTFTTQNDYSTQHSNWKFALLTLMIQNQGLYFVSIFSSRLTLQLYKLDFTRLSLDQNFAIKHFIFMYPFLYMTCDWFDWRWPLGFIWSILAFCLAACRGAYCIVRRHKNKSHLVTSEEWGREDCCLLPWSAGASKPATVISVIHN